MLAALILAGVVLLAAVGAIGMAMTVVSLLWLLDKWQDRDSDDNDLF